MKFRNSLDDVVQVPATKTLPLKRCWIGVAISLGTSKDVIRKFLYLFYVFNCPKKNPYVAWFSQKHDGPSKRRKLFIQPHSLISQKTWIFQTRTFWSLSASARRSVGITVETSLSAGTYDKILLGSKQDHSKLSYTDKETDRRTDWNGGEVRGTTLIIGEGELETFPALQIPNKCPFVLLVKVDCCQGIQLGSKGGNVMQIRMLEMWSRTNRLKQLRWIMCLEGSITTRFWSAIIFMRPSLKTISKVKLLYINIFSSYLTEKKICFHYADHSVNSILGNTV
jgi:hypothetical protein